MKAISLFIIMLLCISTQAQEFYNNSDLDGIDTVIVRLPVSVKFTQSDQASLMIKGTEDLTKNLILKREKNVLTMAVKPGFYEYFKKDNDSKNNMAIEVLLPVFNKISISGSGNTFFNNLDTESSLKIKNSGSGDLFGQVINANQIEITTEGSGNIKLSSLTAQTLEFTSKGSGDTTLSHIQVNQLELTTMGSGDFFILEPSTANTVEITSLGSGNVDIQPVQANNASIKLIGSGDIRLHAMKSLEVSAIGSGDIQYSGPASLEASNIGSGEIKHTLSNSEI